MFYDFCVEYVHESSLFCGGLPGPKIVGFARKNTSLKIYLLFHYLADYKMETISKTIDGVGQMENSSEWVKESGEHVLQTPWAFWYDKKQSKKTDSAEFYSRLTKLGSFDTVESFWKMYLYMKRPSALDVNVNLYLFRDGRDIAPMWEAFPRGGCWILKVKKRKDSGASVLGKIWNDMVIATIGECFEEPDVVGISVCIRKAGNNHHRL